MSDDLVKRAREALNGVTDGPWLALDYTDADEPRWHVLPPDKHGTIASLNLDREADAHFIAAARDLVPDMADRIEELEAKLAACEKYRDAYAECDRIATQAVRELEAEMSDHIYLEVQMINRKLGIAILSDGQEVPVAKWINANGECDAEDAVSCVVGPCFGDKWYSVDLRDYEHAIIN